VAILDKLETTAAGLTTKASTYYSQSTQFHQNQKENLLTTAHRPVHYLLNYTESLLDRVLPPHENEIPAPIIETLNPEGNYDYDDEETPSEGDLLQIIENPITRVKRITLSMPNRLVNFTSEKIIPLRVETVGYATEILKYAYERVDVEGKKALVFENTSVIQKKLEDKRGEILELAGTAKEILQRQTADIKDKSIQALVTSVSAIAHVSEIISRQLTGRVLDSEKLHAHLKEVTNLTKIAISKLKEKELSGYVEKFKETSQVTIQALIDITYAYTPDKFVPLLDQLSKITHLKSQKGTSEIKELKIDETSHEIN